MEGSINRGDGVAGRRSLALAGGGERESGCGKSGQRR